MRRRLSVGFLVLVATLCAGLVASVAIAAADRPGVTMGTASGASYTSAHVTGEVDPKGVQTHWTFEVSTNGTDWQGGVLEGDFPKPGEPDAPTGPQPIAGDLQGLKPSTTYQVRLSAFNFVNFELESTGAPYPEFTTLGPVDPPVSATANDASEVAYTTAKATGKVERPAGNSNSAFDVNCRFEYVTDQQFSENVGNGLSGFEFAPAADCAQNPVKQEGTEVPVSAQLENLSINTTYHLRLHAENAGGSLNSDASDTFTTLNPSAPVVTIDPVTTFDATTAHFSGHVTPGGSDQVFATNWEFHCSPLPCPGASGQLAPGTSPKEVKFDVKDLEPNTTYNVELSATNTGGTTSAGPVSFTTLTSAPAVTTLAAFPLKGGTSALLGGNVNPHNSATTWWVEYGPTAAYGQSTAHLAAGSGAIAKLFSGQISGLSPGATYHFRLVAEGAGLTTHGEDVAFTMPASSGSESCENAQYRVGASAELPDCRAYELVSPPDTGGTAAWYTLDASNTSVLSAWSSVAVGGNAVVWRATPSVPGIAGANGQFDNYLSARDSGSWHTQYMGPPSETASTRPADLMFASSNVNRLLFRTFDQNVTPDDQDPVPARSETNFENDTLYEDLYISAADGTNTHVNRGSIVVPAGGENTTFVGASEDLHDVLFATGRKLEPQVPDGSGALYWTDGQNTKVVNKDENGTLIDGSQPIGLSGDGSTAVFMTHTNTFPDENTLYIWFAKSEDTVRALGPVRGISADSISKDGRMVFFTTDSSLSPDDTDSSGDLYEYDTATHQTSLLSAPAGGGALGNSNVGVNPVIEAPDGSSAYFASAEQIVPGQGIPGRSNLYRSVGGQIRFVATLNPGDPVIDGGGVPGGYGSGVATGSRTRQVRLTPDGSKLVFMSRAALTGYDNAGFFEIYVYDSHSGTIVCASCRTDGTPSAADSTLFSYAGGAHALIGGQYSVNSLNSDIHGDRIFFNSGDALIPQDVNGKNDVYEYDVATGTTALISTGRSGADSAFAGSGADGRDVFFYTGDTLVPQDQNGFVYKVYDARVGGGFPAPPPSASSCEGDGCHGAPSAAPGAPGPATSSFSGAGNPETPKQTCRKGSRRVRRHGKVRCVKKHYKQHHKRHAKQNRRAGR